MVLGDTAAKTRAPVVWRMIAVTAYAAPTPSMIPTTLPTPEIVTDSERNWTRMCARRAPVARRRPISRVRSATDASSTFMIPIPPTSSEIPVSAPMRSLKRSTACDACSARPRFDFTLTRSLQCGP